MCHIFFVSDSVTCLTDYDILCIDTKQLGDGSSSGSVMLVLIVGYKYVRIVREVVSFQAEVVE